MRRKAKCFKLIAILFIGVFFLFGITQTAYCEELKVLDDTKKESYLNDSELASLEKKAQRNTELLNIRSGDEETVMILVGIIGLVALISWQLAESTDSDSK